MTNAQTEARAIQRYIAPSAGRGAVVQLLKHCDGEWVRYEDHATALAAKDAELAAVKVSNNKWLAKWERAEAHLAEANKALEPLKKLADAVFYVDENGREMNAGKPDDASIWGFDDAALTYGHLRAARRAREAQGGENV